MAELCLFGHSFIRRVASSIGDRLPVELGGGGRIHHVSHSGGTSQNLRQDVEKIPVSVGVVFVQTGGNDIGPHYQQPARIADDIINLVNLIRQQRPFAVIIVGSLFVRLKPRGLTESEYNDVKNSVNRLLRHRCSYLRQVLFWNSSRKMRYRALHFDRWGVHLNDAGNRLFANSIRAAYKMAMTLFW
ncbi:hypothetical protein SNE40_021107 [Patella caerulea]|uniref:SGNH hydrolase-type esterase domain-containing protein n=1 Tax=Patella caerulea TaxID=87958 RepID=A0AAN8IXL7_PATCE